ncbi:M23 family metallopeptidase [Rudanella lutea]|uniref:M23 family metallopeptidase n=1 Tax=Rudanella lutea TaxID=451374 RepID=UPI00037A793C|nr:M23 family metallopeptidase [Rudanella lutea]
MKRFLQILPLLSLLALTEACTSSGPAGGIFKSTSPHDQYARSLTEARLNRTALGRDWVAAGERALRDSLRISVPYRESGYFSANRPFAVGYQINAQRGDRLIIRVEVQGQPDTQVFIDVFSLDEQKRPDRAVSARADTNVLTWEPRRSRPHLIRIQPELLRSGRYTISVTREPVLSFPVQGLDSRQISSYFGVPRDGGRRRHEGVDIFAPRGTPVLAGSDGLITRVGVNQLGGNIVFLSDNARNQNLYYAHLDRWNVTDGQRVSVGDTVGFVGNTGNARTTAPHLHFGIYTFGEGAVDPLPYIRRGSGPARQALLNPDRLGDSVRVGTTRALIRTAPKPDAPVVEELTRSALLTLLGGTTEWLRVELPDSRVGYVANSTVERAAKPLRRLTLPRPAPLLDRAHPQGGVIVELATNTVVDVLGLTDTHQLVRLAGGLTGWVERF